MDGINVTFTPATETSEPMEQVVIDVTTQQAEAQAQNIVEDTTANEEEAKKTIAGVIDYLKSGKFKADVQAKSKKTGIPAFMIAKGAVKKMFGIIADILGIVVSTACQTVTCLISILESVLKGVVTGIETLASGLIKVATFNQSGVIA
jgi:hypothetical protein